MNATIDRPKIVEIVKSHLETLPDINIVSMKRVIDNGFFSNYTVFYVAPIKPQPLIPILGVWRLNHFLYELVPEGLNPNYISEFRFEGKCESRYLYFGSFRFDENVGRVVTLETRVLETTEEDAIKTLNLTAGKSEKSRTIKEEEYVKQTSVHLYPNESYIKYLLSDSTNRLWDPSFCKLSRFQQITHDLKYK